jgi:AcrR family transcriptional regulator
MAGSDWLTEKRTGIAAERILDAAGQLFAQYDPGSVGMREIARSAGCSRATLYRYFENRDALYTAYVHREAHAVSARMTERLAGVTDPHQRLIAGITGAMAMVRQNPALAAWFTTSGPPIGAEMADRSAVITAITAAFVASLGPGDNEAPEAIGRRARWVVRVMMSLLIFPGRDAADEKAMLEEFVAPVIEPAPFRSGPG